MPSFELIAKVAVLILVWAALSLPVFAAAFFTGRGMKRRGLSSRPAAVVLGLVVAVLLAPVPTPIITFFAPNGFMLFSPDYYARVFGDDGLYRQLRPWVAISVTMTSIVSVAVTLRLFAEPDEPALGLRPPGA